MSLPVPYKNARVVVPQSGSKDQRWFIKFYAFDLETGKTVLKRYYKIPEEPTKTQRLATAKRIADVINKKLQEGYVIGKPAPTGHTLTLGIGDAVSLILKSKTGRPATIQNYRFYTGKFLQFLRDKGWYHLPSATFTEAHFDSFHQYLRSTTIGPRTINNYTTHIRTIFAHLVESDLLKTNPTRKIKKLKEETHRNVAYLPTQQQEILEFSAKHPFMNLLIKFMYYTLARTKELTYLQVKHIGLYHENKIYIPSEVSKNGVERHIIIPKALQEEIEKYNLKKLPPNHYIFSRGVKPGPERWDNRRLGEKYRAWILAKLKYPVDYTLYSWKHTGVIAAHKAGISDDDIMKQTGHLDYGSFKKYLRSLGIYDNQDFADRIPVI
jgi:integrase